MAKKPASTDKRARKPAARQPGKKPASRARAAAEIYPLKITLARIEPPIWRRVQVTDCTLADLHDVIQAAMGWQDAHLHVFKVGDQEFGLPEQWQDAGGWDDSEVADSGEIKLSTLRAQGVKKFKYEYDMGDGWEHTIQFEKPVPPEAGAVYPRCVDGSRACPPEDCGGPWGYLDLLAAVANPRNADHAEMLEWLGGDFDPEEFDLKAVNKDLKRLR